MMTPEEIAEIRRDGWHGLAPDQIDRICDELDARNGEIRCLKSRIAAMESSATLPRYDHQYAPNGRGGCKLCRRDESDGAAALPELNRVYGDVS